MPLHFLAGYCSGRGNSWFYGRMSNTHSFLLNPVPFASNLLGILHFWSVDVILACIQHWRFLILIFYFCGHFNKIWRGKGKMYGPSSLSWNQNLSIVWCQNVISLVHFWRVHFTLHPCSIRRRMWNDTWRQLGARGTFPLSVTQPHGACPFPNRLSGLPLRLFSHPCSGHTLPSPPYALETPILLFGGTC